jgi:hypothetical protein
MSLESLARSALLGGALGVVMYSPVSLTSEATKALAANDTHARSALRKRDPHVRSETGILWRRIWRITALCGSFATFMVDWNVPPRA